MSSAPHWVACPGRHVGGDITVPAHEIEHQPDNTPRSLRLGRKALRPSGEDKTTLMVSAGKTDSPGGLETLDAAWQRRAEVEGFPVCHPADIIRSKEAANRAKDRESLPRLRAFREYWVRNRP